MHSVNDLAGCQAILCNDFEFEKMRHDVNMSSNRVA